MLPHITLSTKNILIALCLFTIASTGLAQQLTSLSPSSSAAGGPDFVLTANGSGFANGSVILWNGFSIPTNFASTSQLTAVVPASFIAAQGSASVAVQNPGGATSNALTFTIGQGSSGAPIISTLSPNSATTGGPAFTLTVQGANFTVGAAVLWNGGALSTSFVNASQLTAFVPASLIAVQGSANVNVLNPGGTLSNTINFGIGQQSSGAPVITSLSPSSAAPGGPAFTMTVFGSGFAVGSVVLWNGNTLSTTFVNTSQLTAFVPASLISSQGSASVNVLVPGGTLSNGVAFTISTQSSGTPTISTLSPNSATQGGSAFTLTVFGSNFTVGAAVLWNGSALSTSFVNTSQLTAFVPANLIALQGSASVTVMNAGGATSNALTFTIGQQSSGTPVITTLSPNSTTQGGSGFTLTVFGSNFNVGAVVLWNGSALSTSFVNGFQLTAFVPASQINTQGTALVTVLNPGGATSNGLTFTVGQQTSGLTITSLSPNSATQGGSAFSMTVFGSGYSVGAVVLWNGSALSTSFVSASQLTAFVAASQIASAGSASVVVQNPGGALSNTIAFIINQQTSGTPTISSVSPTSSTVGGAGFTLTVFGSNFVSGSSVQWNNSPLSTTFQGTNQLTASVPAFLIASAGSVSIRVVNPSGLGSNTVAFSVTSGNTWSVSQIADGAGWKTLFQVINLDQVAVNYSFQFWDDNGNQLQLPFLNGQAGVFSGSLGVGGTAFAETPGIAAALSQGWAKVTGSGRIGVLAIFRQSVPGRPDSEGSISGAQSSNRIFLPFNNTGGFVTGVAIANSNPTQTLSVSLTFQADNGATSNGFLSLPPNAHQAFVLTSLFPQLAGQRGSIQFTTSTPDMVVMGLRFSPTNSFTSLDSFQ